jgi:hypothetical protein
MKLSTTITPRIVTGQSKEAIRSKVGALGFSMSTNYSAYTLGRNNDKVVAFNFEKRRPVKEQLSKTYKGKDGEIRQTKIKEHGYWMAYYYTFSIDLLKSLGLKVVQHKRHFSITPV